MGGDTLWRSRGHGRTSVHGGRGRKSGVGVVGRWTGYLGIPHRRGGENPTDTPRHGEGKEPHRHPPPHRRGRGLGEPHRHTHTRGWGGSSPQTPTHTGGMGGSPHTHTRGEGGERHNHAHTGKGREKRPHTHTHTHTQREGGEPHRALGSPCRQPPPATLPREALHRPHRQPLHRWGRYTHTHTLTPLHRHTCVLPPQCAAHTETDRAFSWVWGSFIPARPRLSWSPLSP